jgi:hypothetical protein
MLAAHKAGDDSGCIKRGVEMAKGYYHNPFVEQKFASRPVGRAILHNLDLCEAARDKKYREIKSTSCTFKDLRGKPGLVGVPVAFSAKEAGGCLYLARDFQGTPEQRDDAETPDPALCPGVRMAAAGAGSLHKVVNLSATNGALQGCEVTCGIDKLSLVTDGKRPLVRIRGATGYCGGGTGSFIYDGIYAWQGTSLQLIDEVVAALH